MYDFINLLRETGFTNIAVHQTIFGFPEDISEIQAVKEGFENDGYFAVISADKMEPSPQRGLSSTSSPVDNEVALESRGGIDLSPSHLNIKVRGEGIDVLPEGMPFEIENFQGFSFKIIKIERINKYASKKGGEEELASLN